MFALGAYLLSAVASLSTSLPAHASEPLASTFEQAACDPSDSGECAQETEVASTFVFGDFDLPPAPAVLDCSDARMPDFGGWCDLPHPQSPLAARAASLHNGNQRYGMRAGHVTATTPLAVPQPQSDDTRTLLPLYLTFLTPPASAPLVLPYVAPHGDSYCLRLERPPRV